MNLSEAQLWVLIAALVVMTTATKAFGPAVFGGRDLPRWAAVIIAALAPALLAALVVTSVLADGRRIAAGADTVGVAVAAGMLLCRVPLLVACLTAVVVTALLRAQF